MIFVVSLCLLVAIAAGDEKCGVSPAPGANPVLAEHVPWVATLHFIESRVRSTFASLIGPKLAVTLASASIDHQIRFQAFLTLPSCENDVPPCKIGVKTAIGHPNYTDPFSGNDIALVILQDKVPDSPFFCLPENGFHPNSLVDKETFVVARYFHKKGSLMETKDDRTKPLTVGIIYVMELEECRRMRSHVFDSNLCASGYGIEPCGGAAAAPLIDRGADSRWTLRALYNYGTPDCGESLYPYVYTNIGAYLQWIKDVQHSYEL